MAKNKQKKQDQKKPYKNPVHSRFGYILIVVITLAMVVGSIGMLVYYIIQGARAV